MDIAESAKAKQEIRNRSEFHVRRLSLLLKALIEEQDSSQAEIERALGLGQGYLSHLLNAKRSPDLKVSQMFAILNTLKVHPAEFLSKAHREFQADPLEPPVREFRRRVEEFAAKAGELGIQDSQLELNPNELWNLFCKLGLAFHEEAERGGREDKMFRDLETEVAEAYRMFLAYLSREEFEIVSTPEGRTLRLVGKGAAGKADRSKQS